MNLSNLLNISYKSTRGQIIGLWWIDKVCLNNDDTINDIENSEKVEVSKLIISIRSSMLRLKGESISADGTKVNYKGIKESKTFLIYLEYVSKLKNIKLEDIEKQQRKGFWINVYNSLIIHAQVIGLNDNRKGGTRERLKLYASASYNIGGYLFSLNDIENGILRGNRKSPTPLSSKPFSKDDPRLPFILINDPRVHFTLNCGAVSCPPIAIYSLEEDEIERNLKLATELFLENNIEINDINKTITTAKIFNWYLIDFGNSQDELLKYIKLNSSIELGKKINECIINKYKIQFKEYDWSLNDIL